LKPNRVESRFSSEGEEDNVSPFDPLKKKITKSKTQVYENPYLDNQPIKKKKRRRRKTLHKLGGTRKTKRKSPTNSEETDQSKNIKKSRFLLKERIESKKRNTLKKVTVATDNKRRKRLSNSTISNN
jgi:hypothetical protein